MKTKNPAKQKPKTVTTDKKTQIAVEKRTILGKKVKQLRNKGVLPANIYGEDFTSQAVSIPISSFNSVYRSAGQTHVIYLNYDKETIPVLIQHVQKHPLLHTILHVDFRKVNLMKKIETEVPIKFSGESDAVNLNKGVLQKMTDSILIEALPDKIPNEIEIDISSLKEVDDERKIKDLVASPDFIFKDDPEKIVVKITAHKEEELTPQTEVEAPEVTEQKEAVGETEEEKPKESATAEEKESAEPKENKK